MELVSDFTEVKHCKEHKEGTTCIFKSLDSIWDNRRYIKERYISLIYRNKQIHCHSYEIWQ